VDPEGLFIFVPMFGWGVATALADLAVAGGATWWWQHNVLPSNTSNNGGPMSRPDPMDMAKGGRQNLENEWSRVARQEPDPCGWLKQQYNQATDTATRMKIKTAQKVLGCRQNSTTNEQCE
jgi:hypothetical protein